MNRSANILAIAGAVLLLATDIGRAETDPLSLMPQEDWDAYTNTAWQERSWVPRLWPAEKVQALLTVYRELAKEDGGKDYHRCADDLAFLGDDEAIDFVTKNGGRGQATPWLRNPKAVPKLAPYLYIAEAKSGIFHVAQSTQAAINILQIVSQTPEFQPDVRDWAASANSSAEIYEQSGLSIVRKWWQKNFEHFKQGHYAEVQSGEKFTPDISKRNRQPDPGEAIAPARDPATPPSGDPVKTDFKDRMPAEAPVSQAENVPHLAYIAAALTCIFVVGLLHFRRSKATDR